MEVFCTTQKLLWHEEYSLNLEITAKQEIIDIWDTYSSWLLYRTDQTFINQPDIHGLIYICNQSAPKAEAAGERTGGQSQRKKNSKQMLLSIILSRTEEMIECTICHFIEVI